MNRLERYMVEINQIKITLTPHPDHEKAQIATVARVGQEGANPGGAVITLKILREGMRRLAVSRLGSKNYEQLGGLSIREKYVDIFEVARLLEKEDTGGFDSAKFIYNRLAVLDTHCVEPPPYCFIYFHEMPKDSDFFIYRVMLRLKMPPEKLKAFMEKHVNLPRMREEDFHPSFFGKPESVELLEIDEGPL